VGFPVTLPSRLSARARRASWAGWAMLAVGGLWALTRPRRVEVHGRSMEPTLADGDRLIVVRSQQPRPGSIVAVRDPRQPDRLLVKRVVSERCGLVDVRGDQPEHSTDSRSFGPVARSAVVGRVLRRYAPAERAGPVR
jgi:nickel-type superoxide dismutase maturation protease